MSDIAKKAVGIASQLVLLPVYAITWVLGSPYLMTLLCIMSEVLVELVVSAVMAGVSLIVSAVILMEDDNRPLISEQPISLPKMIDNVASSHEQTAKSTSTKSLEEVVENEAKEREQQMEETQRKQTSDGECLPKSPRSSVQSKQTESFSISSLEITASKDASGNLEKVEEER